MSRTLRVVGGVGLGQAHLAIVTVIGLWLTPFLLHRVGQHEYGLWLLALQLVGYLQLLDFGVVALLPRETAYARGRVLSGEDPGVVGAAVDRIRGVVRWQLPVVVLVGIAAWWVIPDGWRELRGPFAWLLAFFVLTFPMRAYQAALQGMQDLVFLGQLQIASWTVSTLLMVGLVIAGYGLASLAAGWLAGQALTFGASWWRLRRRHREIWNRAAPAVPWADARAFFGRSMWIGATQLAQVLLNGSDILLVGAVLGPSAVVPYSCTAKLVQVLSNHPQLLMQAAAPALSEMRMSESRERLASTTSALRRAMLVISGAAGCVMLAINEPFVAWWVGPSLFGGLPLTVLLVAAMLVRHLNTATIYTVFCFGHERRTALTTLADGVVTVAASALLIPWFGLAGVALGAIAGVLAVSLVPNLALLARELGVSKLAPIGELRGWGARFAICAAVAVIVARGEAASGIWPILARASLIAALYTAVMTPYVLQGSLGGYVRQVVAGLRGRGEPPVTLNAA